MKGRIRALFAVLLPVIAVPAGAIDMENIDVDVDASAVWDNNQSQAQFERDQVEDTSLAVGARVGYGLPLSRQSLLNISAFAELEAFDLVDTLNRTTLGLKGAYRWQPSSAFTAPIVEFNVSWQDDNIKENARDSGVLISQLFVTRRITDRITGTAGLQYRQRDSAGSVWDLEDARVFLNADYVVGKHLAAYFTYSYIDGDTSSSAQREYCNGVLATDILPLINVATAIEEDNAYNNAVCGEWVAYRLDATSNTFTLGANYAFSHSMSADISVLSADVTAKDDSNVSYDRQLIRLSVLKRF